MTTTCSEASTLIADIEQARKLWFDALQDAKERRLKNDKTTETLEESRRKYAPRPVEEMTRKEYNKYGWADVNRVLTKKELARFLGMVGKKQTGDIFPTIFGDKYAITVTDDTDEDSVLIVTDGEFNSPSIDLVIRSKQASNDQIQEIWRDVHNAFGLEGTAEAIADYFGTQVISAVSSDDVQSYEKFRRNLERANSKTNSDDNRADGNGRKNDRADGESDLSKAPDNGAFFDAENETERSKRRVSEAQRKADRETLIQVTERMPTPEGLTERKGNEDLPAAVQAFERTVRQVTETDINGVETARETDIPAAAEEIAAVVHTNTTFAYQDAARNLDAFAKGNTHLRAVLRDTIERPFNAAGGVYSVNLKSRTNKFLQEMAKLGIE